MFDPDETLPQELIQRMNEDIEYKQSGKNARDDPDDSDEMSIQQSAKKPTNKRDVDDAPFSDE